MVENKNDKIYILLTFLTGFWGIHKFYQKKFGLGILYLFTAGIFLVGWIYDIYTILVYIINGDSNDKVKLDKNFLSNKISIDEEGIDINSMITISYGKMNERDKKSIESYLEYDKCYTLPSNFIVLDFETTGLSHENDKIIQIGAIKYEDFKVIDTFETYVNPERDIPVGIQTKIGITNEMVEEAETIEFHLPELLNFIGNEIIVAHNASFDMKFLLQNIHNLNLPYKRFSALDTLRMARRLLKTENHKLETLKKHLNLDKYGSHNATDDCYVTAELYKHCYQLAAPQYEGDVLECYNTVKSILLENDMDSSYLKVNNDSSNYIHVIYFSSILTIKNGKKLYFLTEKLKEDLEKLTSNLVYEIGTKSEKQRTRVMLNSIQDINMYKDLIIEEYEKALENIEFAKKYNSRALEQYFY